MIQRGVITDQERRSIKFMGNMRYSVDAICKVWFGAITPKGINRVRYVLRSQGILLTDARNDIQSAVALLTRNMRQESRLAGYRRRSA